MQQKGGTAWTARRKVRRIAPWAKQQVFIGGKRINMSRLEQNRSKQMPEIGDNRNFKNISVADMSAPLRQGGVYAGLPVAI